jgi:predicted transcriptional regulator
MKRTQVYLNDDLWKALHTLARSQGNTISELIRQALREWYLGKLEERRNAMQSFAGMRADRTDLPDVGRYVRTLRRGSRFERLGNT